MEKIGNRRSRVVLVLAVAAVLWISSHRTTDGGASGQLAKLTWMGRGRVTVDETSGSAGDWNADGFDILSFRHGLARSADGGGLALQDIVITKESDKSTPKLVEAVAQGRVFPKFEIEFQSAFGDAGSLPYLRYELTDVTAMSYDIGGDPDGRPVEEVAFYYNKIKVTHTEYDETGTAKGETEFSWKVEEGEK
jgi:type VI secretion system secreted protein Hcp